MAYPRRLPPIKIKVGIKEYNFLLEILSIHAEREDNPLSNKALKLKEKLLRYSVPIENEEQAVIDIRFYSNEAQDLIYILFNSIDEFEVSTNYYEVLLKVRESIKKDSIEE